MLELVPLVGAVAACSAAGRARATHYRRHRQSPQPERAVPVAHVDRVQPSALTAQERAEVLAVLHSERFADAAPAQVWATLLDEKVYLAVNRRSTGCCAASTVMSGSDGRRPLTRPRSSPS